MKFRQFGFKLFPKLRNRKKKKSKVCHSDFPRDIGRDKNLDYSKSSCYGYYDNLAADDGFSEFISDENVIPADKHQSTNFENKWNVDCYSSFPFQELKIQVENLYGCSQCADNQEHSASTFPLMRIDTPEGNNGSTNPSTISRMRTRIKTNPWLPSPGTTPSPSPTDTVNSILYTPYCTRTDFRSSTRDICKSERGNYPDYHSFLFVEDYVPLSNTDAVFQGLVKIVEQDNNKNDVTSGNDLITHQQLNRQHLLNNLALNLPENSHTASQKRFSYTKFLEYDTDCSSLNSPNLENFYFLNNVHYEIDFGYEEDSDERLENSDLSNDDTFRSVNEILLDESAQVDINSSKHSIATQLCTKQSFKNETEELQKGKKDNLSMNTSADDKEITSPSNMNFAFYEEVNMQESIDTGYASVTHDSDSMPSDDEDDLYLPEVTRARDLIDVNKQGDLDLEWDDDPTTQNLFLDFKIERSNTSTTQSVERNSSRYKTECQCQLKRSRSLADIELSLDEKVTQLRQEKVYVQRKVREAVEEDQIRRQQLCLFRSMSPSNKKHVLHSTLQDLKSRLEHQSVRLQASYDTVLTLQRRLSQKRKKLLPVLETNI